MGHEVQGQATEMRLLTLVIRKTRGDKIKNNDRGSVGG
jgi:hypothetical protein